MPEFALADLGPLHWAAIFFATMLSGALVLRFMAEPYFIDPNSKEFNEEPVFLFDKEELVDCSASARALLTGLGPEPRWKEIARRLGYRFPGFPASPEMLTEKLAIPPRGGEDVCIECEPLDGLVRVRIRKVAETEFSGLQPEAAALLREGLANAPYPIWITEISGDTLWTNSTYDELFEELSPEAEGKTHPLRQVPGLTDGKTEEESVRIAIGQPGQPDHRWFDVTRLRIEDLFIYYASDVTSVVSAEVTQRNFVQTLAKTFAQLSIGLAIFDRQRQLVLFNPALLDLTNLPVDFLSARPQLLSVFDRLRDLRIMPEPKNLASWREQMADLVREASEAGYSDIWTLPNGSTYRITGRPHPDGAVAFLFEDVSSEVSLTRRFRSDVRLGSSIMDEIDDGLIVFDTSGVVALCNRAYRELWKTDPDAAFADYTLGDAMRFWRSECQPGPEWEEIRDSIANPDGSGAWTIRRSSDGVYLKCRVDSLPDGATLVRFHAVPPRNVGTTSTELRQTT